MLLTLAPFHSSSKPLPSPVRSQLKAGGFWHKGCPVALSGLRLLTVSDRGFEGHAHAGELIVNRAATGPLTRSFRRLYALRFPIRHGAFRAAGWGWGGAWTGNTNDYMHFSSTGH